MVSYLVKHVPDTKAFFKGIGQNRLWYFGICQLELRWFVTLWEEGGDASSWAAEVPVRVVSVDALSHECCFHKIGRGTLSNLEKSAVAVYFWITRSHKSRGRQHSVPFTV